MCYDSSRYLSFRDCVFMATGDLQKKQRGTFARDIFLVLAISAAVAIVLMLVFPPYSKTMGRAVGTFIIALIYGTSIGAVMVVFFNRFGDRIGKQAFPANWILMIAALVALSAVGCLMAGFILVAAGVFERQNYWNTFLHDVPYSWAISIVVGITISLYERLREKLEAATLQLREKELAAERARKLAIEARLSSLESRIHPHFLFNTLNSISSLIQEDPRQAERLVERLAALLRFSLDSNQRSTVPMSQELKITRDYLEIEHARIGPRLRYSIEVPSELESIEVPPLSVQTLVENSLKHAVSPRREGGEIQITARVAGERLIIEVTDDGPGFAPDRIAAGHGLDNLQSRLAALFDNAAALDIVIRDGRTVVSISWPLVEARAILTA
jgi:two-component system sensor histidine kinase AlgZ